MPLILAVDDEPSVRMTLQLMLAGAGHKVILANNGADALEKFRASERPVDLIVTDILMPKKEGTEFISTVKKESPHTPVLAISGGGNMLSAYDTLAAAKALADEILRKPFTEDDLLPLVNKLLEANGG